MTNQRQCAIKPAWGIPLVLLLTIALVGAACGSSPTPTPLPTDTPVSTGMPDLTSPQPDPTPTTRPTDTPTTPVTDKPEPGSERQVGEFEGITFVVGEGSETTFTVEEKLASLPLPNDAVVRTDGLTGEVHFDGRPSVIEIDLHSLHSDQSRRDNYIRTRMFPNHPVATFTLDDARTLPEGFEQGETAKTQVMGELDIRGVQVPITFDVEARDDGDVIHVLGRINFVWSDFDMTAPSIGGFVQVTDDVSMDVLLALRPAPTP